MKAVDKAAVERLAGVHEFGMEPDVIGARVIDAMRHNRLHIFSHPDHKDEMRTIFDEIIAEYQDYPKDPGFDQRVAFEKFRHDAFAEARRKSRARISETNSPLPFRGEGWERGMRSAAPLDSEGERTVPHGQIPCLRLYS
jgi:hypothetical protein